MNRLNVLVLQYEQIELSVDTGVMPPKGYFDLRFCNVILAKQHQLNLTAVLTGAPIDCLGRHQPSYACLYLGGPKPSAAFTSTFKPEAPIVPVASLPSANATEKAATIAMQKSLTATSTPTIVPSSTTLKTSAVSAAPIRPSTVVVTTSAKTDSLPSVFGRTALPVISSTTAPKAPVPSGTSLSVAVAKKQDVQVVERMTSIEREKFHAEIADVTVAEVTDAVVAPLIQSCAKESLQEHKQQISAEAAAIKQLEAQKERERLERVKAHELRQQQITAEHEQLIQALGNDICNELMEAVLTETVERNVLYWIQDCIAEKQRVRVLLRRWRKRFQHRAVCRLEYHSIAASSDSTIDVMNQPSRSSQSIDYATLSSVQRQMHLSSYLRFNRLWNEAKTSAWHPLDFKGIFERALDNVSTAGHPRSLLWKLSAVTLGQPSHISDWIAETLSIAKEHSPIVKHAQLRQGIGLMETFQFHSTM